MRHNERDTHWLSHAPKWVSYTGAILLQLALVALLKALHPIIPLSDFPAPYAAVLLLTMLWFGDGPGFAAWVVGAWNYFYYFVPPYNQAAVAANPRAWTQLIAYLIVTVTVMVGTSLLRRKNIGLNRLAAALRERAAMLDVSWDAIVVHEVSSGRIVSWNRGAENIFGFSREEAEGQVALSLLATQHPIERAEILAYLKEHPRWEGDLVHCKKNGERVVVSSCWMLYVEEGRSPLVLEASRDVTQLRKLEEERAEVAALQQHVAVTLQKSLLMSPPFDVFPGLTAKACYQSAEEDVLVGGDFFDVYAVDKNAVALVVGDATGKGLDAALYTAEVKFVLRAFLREYPWPQVAMTRLNSLLAQKEWPDPSRGAMPYVAVAAAVIDVASGKVTVAAAGINSPVVVRAQSGEVTALECGGPPLGVIDKYEYEAGQCDLAVGDTIALFSDGLTEARNRERPSDFFGEERLAELIRLESARQPSLSEVGYSVVEQVRRFAGGSIGDDACLLLAKRTVP